MRGAVTDTPARWTADPTIREQLKLDPKGAAAYKYLMRNGTSPMTLKHVKDADRWAETLHGCACACVASCVA